MKNEKSIRWAAALGVLLAFAAYPLGLSAKEKFEQKFEKTEALDKDGRVSLKNISGTIAIKTWAEAKVKIEALKVSEASSLEKAKANADKVQIVVEKTGNILRIETKYPDRENSRDSLSVRVDYNVWLPEKASLKVNSVSGNVTAEGLGGALDADLVSGNATLSKLTGGVDCRLVSGTLNASDIASDVNLRTISGGILAERIKGSVEAETTSGAIRLRDISGARSVRAKVLSGNITYDGDLAKDGKYDLEALSGRIEMTVPANAGFDLEAETFSGGLQSDFAVTMSGRISAKEIRGAVNNGGASVRLKSFSGSIALKKK